MTEHVIVKDFIQSLDPEDLPLEYLHAAKFKDINGQEVVLKGNDLKRLLTRDPTNEHQPESMEVEVLIDVSKIMKAINVEVEYIYYCVEQLFLAEQSAEQSGKNDSN